MAEKAENNPVDSSTQGNGAINATPEAPDMDVVRAARDAFFARARDGRAAPDAPASDVQPAATATPSARQAGLIGQGVSSAPSDVSGAIKAPEERIASRHGGDGLLAVGVLSDLGSERAYRVWASGDSEDLKLIADPQAREKAFDTIVDNMRMPQYREALSLVDYGLEREALRTFNARDTVNVESPTSTTYGAAEAPSAIATVRVPADLPAAAASAAATEAAEAPSAARSSETVEENSIEAVPAPKLEQSPDQVSDAEKRRETERNNPIRDAGARLLDAFTRSLVGRERSSSGNEISSPAVMTKDGYGVPEAIASRYVVRDGDFWRFDEKDPGNADKHEPKFTDKGPRLATRGDDRGTAADMVTVAQAKGWQQVTLKGSEPFRRNAWMEAQLAGIKTHGFEPKEQDRAMLEAARRERDSLTITAGKRAPEASRPLSTPAAAPTSKQPSERIAGSPNAAASVVVAPTAAVAPADQPAQATSAAASPAAPAAPIAAVAPTPPTVVTASAAQIAPKDRPASEQPTQNTLLTHGAAPYKNDKDNADSYYVSYRESDGATKTVWGKDLERAIRDSGVQPGDALTLENLGSRPVTVNRSIKDAQGKVVGVEQIETRLNVWEIQKQEKQSPGSQAQTAAAMNVAGLREQVEKALAGQPDNVVREVMDRLAERLQAGIAVQTEQQKAASPAQDLKPAINTRLAQVDVDREARQLIAEAPKPQRNPERDVAKQTAPSVAR
ncbi:LPD7 domain-containing protein [Caballeronia sordidicola]|uniref:IncQ plasmid conjugative transfer DNA primase TraO (PTi TraA) n=1 Tax=Caballeronia sordidicola TaxID=196367 RepID=A0A226WKI9_CABSO|nr:LPD7 domain-containing protein [Caballeronia sordidicola]OXC71714.1 IncQ plasmid conjugative transfer DNA primase TraO (pTi TraA) [Caballeronia sordidicola]